LKYKLICFDLDGVLVKEKSSWEFIHTHLRVNTNIRLKNIDDYSYGKMDYQTWVARDIMLWNTSKAKLDLNELDELFNQVKINEEAEECINKLKNMNLKIAIISAGIYELAQKVAKKLGIEIVYANPLPRDTHGNIIAKPLARVVPFAKSRIISSLAKKMKIPLSNVAYVGDSLWDVSAFRIVGCSIGYKIEPRISEYVNVIVEDLREIPIVLKMNCRKAYSCNS